MIDILGKRYWYFGLSLLFILPGLIILAVSGLPLSIEFTGGSILEVQIAAGPEPEQLRAVYTSLEIRDPAIQTTGNNTYIIRTTFLDEDKREEMLSTLGATFGDVKLIRYDSVGPSIGEQVTQRAGWAILASSLAVVLFLVYAFRGMSNAPLYGATTFIAIVHDIAVIFSLAGITYLLLGWEINALFLTALLTSIGFSVHDSVVVFDRIRENSHILRRTPYETLVNHSIIQILPRSINTQMMTAEFLLLSLALFGGATLQQLAVILLVGLFSGTYSSLFIAAPLMLVWENSEWKKWFDSKRKATA
jgi:preprotein translocase subunit SecF